MYFPVTSRCSSNDGTESRRHSLGIELLIESNFVFAKPSQFSFFEPMLKSEQK